MSQEDSESLKLIQSLLLAIRKRDKYTAIQNELANLSTEQLLSDLNSQSAQLTFWINAYNAFYQIIVRENPTITENRGLLYKNKHFTISNNLLSLDQVEHGILRKRKFKYSLGYLPSFFDTRFVKQFQVDELDCRIHFALNCGAKSCPPIAFYRSETINQDLEMATTNFLEQESELDKETNTVYVSKILFWYLGDFGGKSGIREILKKHNIIEETSQAEIKFKEYNWELDLENYIDF